MSSIRATGSPRKLVMLVRNRSLDEFATRLNPSEMANNIDKDLSAVLLHAGDKQKGHGLEHLETNSTHVEASFLDDRVHWMNYMEVLEV